MDDESSEVAGEDDSGQGARPITDFQIACFCDEQRLPSGDDQLLVDAARAVHQEYRECSRWKRLHCRQVSAFAERGRGAVFVLHVGDRVEFDWTWEGAIAFRPRSLDDNQRFSDLSYEEADYPDEIVWQGEVLEVDQHHGCLFISVDHPEAMPTSGSFFVRPFEFLSVLETLYNSPKFSEVRSDLAARLAATQGNLHPRVRTPRSIGLPFLHDWWEHSWSVLWGPPGTGKTWLTGQQVAAVLEDPSERVLVVSTTNRATDAVALAIGNAARDRAAMELNAGKLVRIGKGASLRNFTDAGLEVMLRGTEAALLREIDDLAEQLKHLDNWEEKALTRKRVGQLRMSIGDQSKRQFIDADVRVVIATAFKATCYLQDELVLQMLETGDTPFTTILIDEAGLMSRAATAALSLLAARRVVLVGDSKQLAPISRISRVLPRRHQTWLASSGLSHLDNLDNTPAGVHVLSQQRRMHSQVCRVVSDFHYGGFLKTAPEIDQRSSSLPPILANHSRAIWYVLDAEGSDLAAIRAQRGPGNRSWTRSITPAILEKLFLDPGIRQAKGLFISPYQAQSKAVAKLFSAWGLTSWEASTVHSQQGSESDIVLFDSVNAGSYSWPFDEWKRLVNVALSRAREAIVVFASRAEMDEPYLQPLIERLTPSVLVQDNGRLAWEKVPTVATFTPKRGTMGVGESPQGYHPQQPAKDSMGEQIRQRRDLKPILSREQQRLVDLSLDGKPRLVRGVAGSGKSIVLCNWLAKTVQRLQHEPNARIWAVYANRSLHKLLQESIELAWKQLGSGELLPQAAFPWEQVSLLHVKDVLAGMLPSVALSMDSFEFDYDRAAAEFLCRQDGAELLPRCSALFIDEAQDMGPSTLRLLLSLVDPSDTEDANSRPAHIFYDNDQNIYGRKTPTWSEFGLDMRGRSTILRESFRSTKPITELAVNVLYRLTPDEQRKHSSEWFKLGLLESSQRGASQWLRVRYSQVNGPRPILRSFRDRRDEMAAIASDLKKLIQVEGISPSDICLIYTGKLAVQTLQRELAPELSQWGVELSVQTNRPFQRQENTLVVTTSHSYKGYESEVVMIPCVDQFVTGSGTILANSLYVAMTRARSLLAIYGSRSPAGAARRIHETISACLAAMNGLDEESEFPPKF